MRKLELEFQTNYREAFLTCCNSNINKLIHSLEEAMLENFINNFHGKYLKIRKSFEELKEIVNEFSSFHCIVSRIDRVNPFNIPLGQIRSNLEFSRGVNDKNKSFLELKSLSWKHNVCLNKNF